jgi:hypothetical protein
VTEDEKGVADAPDVRSGAVEIPLNLGLLEEVPTVESGEAYALPDPAVLAELAEAEEIERKTAEQVATVRDEQSLRIANLAQDGVNHFLVNVEGQELCGSCGEPFPCSKWVGEIEPRNLAESSGQPVQDEDKVRAVAELLGVDIEKARQIVLASTPLDELQ